MSTPDAGAELEADHQEIARSVARLLDFAAADDVDLVREEWDELEARVLRHLDAEEMMLLPAFERARAADGAKIRDAHAKIRALLGENGIAVDLHALGRGHVIALRDALEEHAAHEATSMYAWARAAADRQRAATLTGRLRRVRAAPREGAAR